MRRMKAKCSWDAALPVLKTFRKTQQDIDAEVRRILDEQYQVAYKILDENRDKMETMCKALMDWETIDRDQVLEIYGRQTT